MPKVCKWHVYFVRCSDESLYCGITTDISRRVIEHNSSSKGAKYTRSRRPVKLVWYTKVSTRQVAASLEYKIKKLKKMSKEKIIDHNFDYDDIIVNVIK